MKEKIILFSLYAVWFFCLEISENKLCAQDTSHTDKKYLTERVIVLVIDGPRYSETWGDKTHQYIPYQANYMAESGIMCTNFYNDGYTYTTSGHAALCTGVRQELENSKGTDLPQQPSIFQYYLKQSGEPSSKAWLITSKDKLFILGNCNDPKWNNKFNPSSDCGNKGQLSGYRKDTVTFNRVMNVLKKDQPNLMLVNFKEPDGAGHANNWPEYLKGIKETDSLVWEVWKFIQTDQYYKDKTSLFITNDHGRHLDGWKDGFVNHGDDCDGCRHINLFAFGPDFKRDFVLDKYYVQVDIPATVAELLGFPLPYGQGRVMKKLFKE
jgi:hypothetical protein